MTESLLYQWDAIEGYSAHGAPEKVRVFWDNEEDEFSSIKGLFDGEWFDMSERYWAVAGTLAIGLKEVSDQNIEIMEITLDGFRAREQDDWTRGGIAKIEALIAKAKRGGQ